MMWKEKKGYVLQERSGYSFANMILSILSVIGRVLVGVVVLTILATTIYVSSAAWMAIVLTLLAYSFYPLISNLMERIRFKYVKK